ncbi:MAG: hypothetical protein HUJ56_00995, partial [Erysipelotrichaceae bacterium]|nr:hypothetical protein [Erysipelotrichaceae bacterium]
YEGDYVQSLGYEKEDLYALLRSIEKESFRVVIERFNPINSFLLQEGMEWSTLLNKSKFVFCFHVSERIPSSLLNGCKTKLSLVKDKSVIMDCLMVALSKIKESKHPLLFKENHCYALGLCEEVNWEIKNKEVVTLATLEDQILPEEGLIGKNTCSLEKVYFKSEHPHVVGDSKSLDLFKSVFELANRDTSLSVVYETQRSYPSEEVVELGSEKAYQGVYTYQGKREVIQLVGFHRHHS